MSTILTQLNTQLLQQGSSYREYAQRASSDAAFAQNLIRTVYSSRSDETVQIAAANALSILVAARIELPQDLSGIRVPGAILDEGCFDQTNFEGSDLSNASLCRTWLGGANLTKAHLTGIKTESGEQYTTQSGVTAMAVDEERSLIIYGDSRGRVSLWNFSTKKLQKEVLAQIGEIMEVVLSRDRAQFLTCGSTDSVVKVWSLPGCDLIRSINTLWAGVAHIAVSPTEDVVVACESIGKESRREIKLWNFSEEAGQRSQFTLKEIRGKLIRPSALDFSPCGRYFASITATALWFNSSKAEALNPQLYIWDRTNGTCLAKTRVVGGGSYTVKFSRNGERIATPSGTDVIVWNLAENNGDEPTGELPMRLEEYARLTDHLGKIRSLQFCDEDNTLAVGSDDGTTYLWDIELQTLRSKFDAKVGRVWRVYCTQDNERIITGGSGKKLCLWEKAGVLQIDPDRMSEPWHISPIPGSRMMATADTNGYVKIWDSETGRCIQSVKAVAKAITHLNVSRDGSRLVSSTDFTNHIFIHDAQTAQVIAQLRANRMICEVKSTSFTPDNKHLAAICDYSLQGVKSFSNNNRISVWNISDQKLLYTLERVFKSYYYASFSFVHALTNELTLLCVDQKGHLLLWEASNKGPHVDLALGPEDRELSTKISWRTLHPKGSLNGPKVATWHRAGQYFDYSQEKHQLAVVTRNKDEKLGRLRAFDCNTGQVVFKGGQSIYATYFANGERIASVIYLPGGGKAVRVRETSRGEIIQTVLLDCIQSLNKRYNPSSPLFGQARQEVVVINNGKGLSFINDRRVFGVAKLTDSCARLRWCTNTTLEVSGAIISDVAADPDLIGILKQKGAKDSPDPPRVVREEYTEDSPLLGHQHEDPGCCSVM